MNDREGQVSIRRVVAPTAVVGLLATGLAASQAWAQESAPATTDTAEKLNILERTLEEPWRFRLQPYGWIPWIPIKAELEDSNTRSGTITLDDILKDLKFLFEGTVQVRKGPFGVYLDTLGIGLVGNEEVDDAIRLKVDDDAFLWNYGLSFEAGRVPFGDDAGGAGVAFEPYVGLRTLRDSIEVELNFSGSQVADRNVELDFTVPVVGLRTYWDLTERWNLYASADIGGWDVEDVHRTWQAVSGVGYKFHIGSVPANFLAGYRTLHVDYREDGADLRITVHGPIVSLALDF